jgi:hypothetical protein
MSIDVRYAQLFLDDEVIEHANRLQRVVHQPIKHFANPLYTAKAPWEGNGIYYLGGVYIDPGEKIWKAWYVTLYPPEYPEIIFAVCMIVSKDGIHWRRPELDVFTGHNGEKTNIVLELGPGTGGTTAPSIMYEPENKDEPWTMFISTAPKGNWRYKGYILRSPDGAHWRWTRDRHEGVDHGMGDRCTAMLGPDPKFPYVIMSRAEKESQKWSLVRATHRAAINEEEVDDKDRNVLVVYPDVEDPPGGQIYHAHGFRYENTYVGLFQWYWETNDPYAEMELITSRDTVHWRRVNPRKPFLPCGPHGGTSGAFDARATDTAMGPPVRYGVGGRETLWFYYWGGPAMHGNRHVTWTRSLGLAQLRVDGFCSLRANRFPATLFTKPMVWPGGKLQVNASVLGGGGGGHICAEVLGEGLEPVDGMTRADADRLAGDGIRLDQTWQGDAHRISAMQGKRIRLKFYLENVDLYSFCSSEEPEKSNINITLDKADEVYRAK